MAIFILQHSMLHMSSFMLQHWHRFWAYIPLLYVCSMFVHIASKHSATLSKSTVSGKRAVTLSNKPLQQQRSFSLSASLPFACRIRTIVSVRVVVARSLALRRIVFRVCCRLMLRPQHQTVFIQTRNEAYLFASAAFCVERALPFRFAACLPLWGRPFSVRSVFAAICACNCSNIYSIHSHTHTYAHPHT